MNNAYFSLVCSGLGVNNHDLADIAGVSARTASRWRKFNEPPQDVQDVIISRWGVAKAQAAAALDQLEAYEAEYGAPPERVDLTIYGTQESANAAGVDESYAVHSNRVALIAFVLEVYGYEVNVSYAPIERTDNND